MRLADSATVDFLSLEKGTGTVVVTLLDDFIGPDEVQRLALLQRKLNRYFDFIESGEVYDQLAEGTGLQVARNRPVRISIVALQDLVNDGRRFLQHVEDAARDANVELTFKVVASCSQAVVGTLM